MVITCPRCLRTLSASPDADPPAFCMYCGQRLRDDPTVTTPAPDHAPPADNQTTGPLPFEEAVAHTLDVIDGLAEVHRLGMIHRDVKPSNCFLTADGRVKVGDFGLSKSLVGSQDRHLTGSGAFLGTVLFASPEQIRGQPLAYASD